MRHVPRAPREGINVSDEHPLKEALILVVGLTGALVAIVAIVVTFVDIVIFFIPPATEVELLADWDYAGLLDAEYESEGAVMLQALTSRLRRHWPDAAYDFRLGVVPDETPNAVALPGGTILVTQGLLDEVESENELAFVLGHELGHFRHRDHLRQLGRGVALGLLLVLVSGQDGGLVSGGVLDVTSKRFSRGQESAADLFALELLFAEYGNVAEATRFFERRAASGSALENVAGYFSTHPAPADRVERLHEAARSRGWPTVAEPVRLDR